MDDVEISIKEVRQEMMTLFDRIYAQHELLIQINCGTATIQNQLNRLESMLIIQQSRTSKCVDNN